jgi:phage terminase large subunit
VFFPTAKVASLLATAKSGTRGELIPDSQGIYKFNAISNGALEVFKLPEPGTKYIIGGDTAEGLAHGDAQVLYVINHKTEECDAVYRSQVDPADLAKEAYQLGKFYNWALLAIEVNKDGLWVNDSLEKMGYVNLYYRKVFDDITQKITKFFGWKTTSATRPFALAALKAIFIRKNEGFPSALLNEMFTFIRNAKGRPEAMDKKHDDVIMASAIGYAVLQEQGKYVDNSSEVEGFSMSKAIFGESMN